MGSILPCLVLYRGYFDGKWWVVPAWTLSPDSLPRYFNIPPRRADTVYRLPKLYSQPHVQHRFLLFHETYISLERNLYWNWLQEVIQNQLPVFVLKQNGLSQKVKHACIASYVLAFSEGHWARIHTIALSHGSLRIVFCIGVVSATGFSCGGEKAILMSSYDRTSSKISKALQSLGNRKSWR